MYVVSVVTNGSSAEGSDVPLCGR